MWWNGKDKFAFKTLSDGKIVTPLAFGNYTVMDNYYSGDFDTADARKYKEESYEEDGSTLVGCLQAVTGMYLPEKVTKMQDSRKNQYIQGVYFGTGYQEKTIVNSVINEEAPVQPGYTLEVETVYEPKVDEAAETVNYLSSLLNIAQIHDRDWAEPCLEKAKEKAEQAKSYEDKQIKTTLLK